MLWVRIAIILSKASLDVSSSLFLISCNLTLNFLASLFITDLSLFYSETFQAWYSILQLFWSLFILSFNRVCYGLRLIFAINSLLCQACPMGIRCSLFSISINIQKNSQLNIYYEFWSNLTESWSIFYPIILLGK